MKKIILCIIIALSLCIEEYPKEENVVVLKDDTFDKFIESHDFVLVKFYAPWCGHCKKLAPEFSKAALTLEKEGYFLAQVDATVEKKLAGRFKISGYPTLKFFAKGEERDYRGGRTESDLVNYVRKNSKDPVIELKTLEEVQKHKEKNPLCLIYFGTNENSIKEYKKSAVGSENDEITFAYCQLKEAQEKYNAKDDSIVLFKNFDSGRNELKENLTKDNINNFLSFYSTPLLMDFSQKINKIIFEKQIPGLILFKNKSKETKDIEEILTKLAEKYLGKLKFIRCDISDSSASRFADYIGVKNENAPTIRLIERKADLLKYKLEKELNEENIVEFIEKFFKKELKEYLKSEPIPTEQNEDVYKIVGESFQKEVLDNDKDVLIKFYAPWCGHCKKLAPTYIELAKKLKNNKKLLIAEVDATQNEVKGVSIRGFPTIKFWPGNKKNSPPIDFKEDRSMDGFIKFLKEHVSNELVIEGEKKEDEAKAKVEKKPDL